MSPHEEQSRSKQHPYFDEGLLINTRLSEVERHQSEEKKYQREYNDTQLRFNGFLVLFTGLLFVTSIISNVLLYRYVVLTKQSADAATEATRVSRDTLGHIKSSALESGKQTERVIDYLKTTAESMKATTAQSKEALASTIKQGKDALDASIETSRLDQRAWVGIGEMRVVNNMVQGEALKIAVIMKNTGKTPALNLRVSARMKFRSRLALPSDVAISSSQQTTLAPGVGDYTWHVQWSSRLTENDIASLNSGRFELTIYGTATYRDIFSGTPIRETGFCGAYNTEDKPLLSSCPVDVAASLSYMK